uniref:Dvir_CG31337 n=1 Tax=Drosophila virilis TaxID=7244 RepID=Q20CA6_DROVI|nr:Dvir_CG31337 [Drosophila virilis]
MYNKYPFAVAFATKQPPSPPKAGLQGVQTESKAWVHTEPSCQTPDKNVGQCVHFSACRFVLRQYAMYKEHMPPHIMRFLQRSRCRPKVDGYHLCCELKDVIPANANSKLK